MSLLSATDRDQLRNLLSGLEHDVRLLFFSQSIGCELCPEAGRILQEVVEASPRVSLDELNLVLEKDKAEQYGITAAPGVAVVRVGDDGAEWDPGIRFLGAPSGYEFMSLVEAVLLVASGDSGLSDESRALVGGVTEPMRIQVFVTPT
jgi:alkyl hydroperoxide reductase subunit AhpF